MSGNELMFKGEGKCHNGCAKLGGAKKDICGSQRRNRRDTIKPKKSCNEPDQAHRKRIRRRARLDNTAEIRDKVQTRSKTKRNKRGI